jgi:hypothetical protein
MHYISTLIRTHSSILTLTLIALISYAGPAHAQVAHPSPHHRPIKHKSSETPLNHRHFLFAERVAASTVQSILSKYGVVDGKLSKSFSSEPLALSDLPRALSESLAVDNEVKVRATFSARAARGVGSSPAAKMDRTFLVKFPDSTKAKNAEDELRANKLIERSSLNFLVQASQSAVPSPSASPTQTLNFNQDHLIALNTSIPKGVSLVRKPLIAVVDSGVYISHPDLRAAIWKNVREIPNNNIDDDKNGFVDDANGANFTCIVDEEDECKLPPVIKDITDREGHGTHVSGIIAGQGKIRNTVRGVAPQAIILPVKGLDDSGDGYSEWLAKAIKYAVDQGADVINCSWGSRWYHEYVDEVVLDAIKYARALGVVIVFAAGNDASDAETSVHSKLDEVIAVSSSYVSIYSRTNPPSNTTITSLSTFSNFGSSIDITAPGSYIWSTLSCPNRNVQDVRKCTFPYSYYSALSGTSMAAPHVAAVAGLILGVNPLLNPDQVRAIIRSSATDAYTPGEDGLTGSGLVNAGAAINRASSIYTARAPLPIITKIVTPALLTSVRQGTKFNVNLSMSGPRLKSYSVVVTSEANDAVVISTQKSPIDTATPSVEVDTSSFNVGRHLISFTVRSSDGTSSTESREFNVVPATDFYIYKPDYTEIDSEGLEKQVRSFEYFTDNGKIWQIEQVRTLSDTDTLEGDFLRLKTLDFSPTSVTTPPDISFGLEKNYLNYNEDGDYSRITFFPYNNSVGGLKFTFGFRIGFPIESIGTIDIDSQQYIPDELASQVVGLPSFKQGFFDLGFELYKDIIVYNGPSDADLSSRFLYFRKGSSAPFIKVAPTRKGGCYSAPFIDAAQGVLLTVETGCTPALPLSPLLIKLPLTTKKVSEALARGNGIELEFQKIPLPFSAEYARVASLDAATVLLLVRTDSKFNFYRGSIGAYSLISGSYLPLEPITGEAMEQAEQGTLFGGIALGVVYNNAAYFEKRVYPRFYSGQRPLYLAVTYSFNDGKEKILSSSLDELAKWERPTKLTRGVLWTYKDIRNTRNRVFVPY